jgi:hypothetical protein
MSIIYDRLYPPSGDGDSIGGTKRVLDLTDPTPAKVKKGKKKGGRKGGGFDDPEPDEEKEPDKEHPDIDGASSEGTPSMKESGGSKLAGDKSTEIKKMSDAMEAILMKMGMSKDSTGGDSNLKAAGDSGMGNPLNYDFIRAEGRAKGTGQNIEAGDQTIQDTENSKFAKENSTKDGNKINPHGQNRDLTQEMLLTRLNNRGSDSILDPVTYDHGRASLRPQFLLGGEDAVRKTARERMEMDVQFDMFDYVPEGYGLGSHNKMFIQENNHDRLIRYAEPMYEPRALDGSELTDEQFDGRLMNQINNPQNYLIKMLDDYSSMGQVAKRQKQQSVDTLADDNNSIKSSKGLRGRNPSPFEPVIRTRSPWIPTIEPAGVNMKRQLKSIFNTQRAPQRHVEYNPHNGMPTLPRRQAMEIILP